MMYDGVMVIYEQELFEKTKKVMDSDDEMKAMQGNFQV